uniref:ATP synthase complex subunit 8 n=1 Tax=Rheobates palmatus TaxID=238108 RepID=A0A7L9CUL4_RHEPL|nr:ATP synthase F0 subunit 8 [Rheobates palmatus]
MPQLDPSPWFFILISSWLILLIFTSTKTSKLSHLNNPSNETLTNTYSTWSWPWP